MSYKVKSSQLCRLSLVNGCVMVHTAEKELPSLVVTSDALQQRESIANSVRGGRSELGRVQKGINGNNLLQKGSHDTCLASVHCQSHKVVAEEQTERMPQNEGQLGHLLSLFAEFE